MSFWLRVGGYPATDIAAHTAPTYETGADGGCLSASWAFALSLTSQHQALRPRALVEVMCGPMPVWSGLMTDPDRTTWECTAYGLASVASKFPALDGLGATTRNVGVAIDTAIAMGWPVSNPLNVTGTAAGDVTGNPTTVGQLLNDYAEQTGQRWGVDARRRIYMRPTPTTPTWLAAPGAAAFGSTAEDRATALIGRYLNSTTSTYESVGVGSGWPVETLDLTNRGAITAVAAEAVLDGLLARDYLGPAWTNGVTLTSDQIQTRGGTPAFLAAVQGGQMMRSLGLSNAVQAMVLDTTIGKTRYTTGEDSIYVEPVNTAPRSFTDVLAAL